MWHHGPATHAKSNPFSCTIFYPTNQLLSTPSNLHLFICEITKIFLNKRGDTNKKLFLEPFFLTRLCIESLEHFSELHKPLFRMRFCFLNFFPQRIFYLFQICFSRTIF